MLGVTVSRVGSIEHAEKNTNNYSLYCEQKAIITCVNARDGERAHATDSAKSRLVKIKVLATKLTHFETVCITCPGEGAADRVCKVQDS
jgi:hypothetical protein